MNIVKRHTKKALITVAGIIVCLIGSVLIFYPGPGVLVIFAGLAILSTEFEWAHNFLRRLRDYYDIWVEWLKCSSWGVRLAVASLTGCVVITTIWVFNGYGLMDTWLGLDMPWLRSPLL